MSNELFLLKEKRIHRSTIPSDAVPATATTTTTIVRIFHRRSKQASNPRALYVMSR
jgi:hypothetical protein